MSQRDYFTLVFKGDIGDHFANPLITNTPFGIPVASGKGNAFDEGDALIDALERIEAVCQGRAKNYDADSVRREILDIAQGALLDLK